MSAAPQLLRHDIRVEPVVSAKMSDSNSSPWKANLAKLGAMSSLREEGLSRIEPLEQYRECRQIEWMSFSSPFKSVFRYFHRPAYGYLGRQWTRNESDRPLEK